MKKYFSAFLLVAASAALGLFISRSGSETFVVKNSGEIIAKIAPEAGFQPAAEEIGNLENNIIPPLKITENITSGLAKTLSQEMISANTSIKAGDLLPGPGINAPDPEAAAQKFIKDGLIRANENILNIVQPNLKVSYDNGKSNLENYLEDVQKILNGNLPAGSELYSTLRDIQKNNGSNSEKLLPIIAGHEIAANELEKIAVPSDLKNLMTEEIRMLRITANVFRAFTNIENDPLAGLAATRQFEALLQNWAGLQAKFEAFIGKINQMK